MNKSKSLTVFIGRFSPFHNGHAAVLKRALNTSKAVLVLIGSAGQARTTKNPFSYDERANMIRSYVECHTEPGADINLKIKPLHDHPYSDQSWIREVQEAVEQVKNELVDVIGLNPTVYLTGSNRDSSTNYLNFFGDLFLRDLVSVNSSEHDGTPIDLNATKIRNIMFQEPSWHVGPKEQLSTFVPKTTLNFLSEFILGQDFQNLVKEFQYIEKYHKAWATAPYTPTFVTVDAVVIQSGHVLVNVRDNFPGKGLWALPGGFVEQDERLIDACVRELREETQIALAPAQLYGSIKSKEIFDNPTRSLRGRTITTAFAFKLDDTKPLPSVKPQRGEVQKVMWIPLNTALNQTENWFEDHHSILSLMSARI